MTVANRKRLQAAHLRWLRRILRISWRDKITNKIVLERTGQRDIENIIRERRLRWLGHVLRMDGDRRAKQVISWSSEEKRRKTTEELAGYHKGRLERHRDDVGRG